MRTLRISVRRLVEFLLRSGDIDASNDRRGGIEAMQAGSNIHRMLQAQGGEAYQAEVSLAGSFFFPGDGFDPYAARLEIREEAIGDQGGFFLRVEGRADGIIDDGTRPLIVDEIKGTSRDVSAIDKPDVLHEAQALCYAYLYLRSSRGSMTLSSAFGEQVVVRITYASMDTGEVRHIERTHALPDVEAWFFSLLEKAQRWAAWRVSHDELRKATLATLSFPFASREGQRQIMDAVAEAIHKDKRLYVQAPTGSGKTIAALYPALKAMGSGEVSRIVYLTAKTMTRRPALECLDLLKRRGIAAHVLVVTARDKLCPLRSNARGEAVRARPLASLCNPVECPLARGHYDLVNDALFDAITADDVLDFEHVTKVAAYHHVCPYELQRDAARWVDVIICDYHFAFAPSAGLMGLADETGATDTVFLVDEAHNLVERMRDMYSAELTVGDFEGLEKLLRTRNGLAELLQAVRAVIRAFPEGRKDPPGSARATVDGRSGTGGRSRVGGRSSAGGREGRPQYHTVHVSDAFEDALTAFADGADAALEQLASLANNTPLAGGVPLSGNARREERAAGTRAAGAYSPGAHDPGTIEVYLTLRDASFKVRAFLGAYQRSEAGYITFLGRAEHGGRRLKVFCVDPSHDLGERLELAKAAVFFSGTLLPMDYHRKLLAAQDDDPSIYAHSSFDHRRQRVFIGTDVTARFSKRGPKLYASIAAYLMCLVRAHPGNYLAFLPSYAMLNEVATVLDSLAGGSAEIVRQRPGMREDERERFVARFREPRDARTSEPTAPSATREPPDTARGANASLIGLCVLGGVFGESIDLPGEALVGVVVVGTGMPGISDEREVIRDYFDVKEGKGFAYAYTFPGMIKVLQAAGRLIRTEKDRGVVLLLDDRFLEDELQKAFPNEWKDVRTCTLKTLPGLLAHA